MVKIYKKKRQVLLDLEAALDPTLFRKMKEESAPGDGSQYWLKLVEFPKVFKIIQREEMGENMDEKGKKTPRTKGIRSARLTRSVGINMGLDLEMRQ